METDTPKASALEEAKKREWLSQGIREGKLTPETGVAIMKLLDEIHSDIYDDIVDPVPSDQFPIFDND